MDRRANRNECKGGHLLREKTYIDFHDLPLLLTPPQVADLLGIPIDAAYDLIRKHKLPHTELSNQVYVRKDELICWLAEMEVYP